MISTSLFLAPTDYLEVEHIIDHLKNTSPGFDNICTKLRKSVKHIVAAPLVHISNHSFASGSVPDQLKLAKIIPIYKKGDKGKFSNYRPVSILPVFAKIL